jgi:hypothetical protein
MAEIIEQRYKTTLRFAEDLRTALEGVVKAYNSYNSDIEYDTRLQYVNAKREMAEAMEYADNVLYDLSHVVGG